MSGRMGRILIVRLSALGDVLHALPTLAALGAALPEAKIDWAVEDRAADFLRGRPELRHVHVLARRTWAGVLRFRAALRAEEYDLVVDLQGNFKSGAVTRSARSGSRVGLDRALSREANHLFLSRRVDLPRSARHRVERNLAMAAAAIGRPLAYRAPPMPRSEEAGSQAAALLRDAGLDERGGHVLLHPGTSAFGAFKRLPADRMGALARRLVADGHPVAVSEGPGESELVADVLAACKEARRLAPPSVATWSEVVARARMVVAPDTATLHLAALHGVALLGLYGPKDPTVYGPYGMRADGTSGVLDVATVADVACRPCVHRRCAAPLCMSTFDVDELHERVRRQIGRLPGDRTNTGPRGPMRNE